MYFLHFLDIGNNQKGLIESNVLNNLKAFKPKINLPVQCLSFHFFLFLIYPMLSFAQGSFVLNDGTPKFTCSTDEKSIAATSGIKKLTIGNANYYIGTRQITSNNQNPLIAKFTNGVLDWCCKDYETTENFHLPRVERFYRVLLLLRSATLCIFEAHSRHTCTHK